MDEYGQKIKKGFKVRLSHKRGKLEMRNTQIVLNRNSHISSSLNGGLDFYSKKTTNQKVDDVASLQILKLAD